jgi:hypothetical protein
LDPKQLAAVSEIYRGSNVSVEEAAVLAQLRNPDIFGDERGHDDVAHYQTTPNRQRSSTRIPKSDASKEANALDYASTAEGDADRKGAIIAAMSQNSSVKQMARHFSRKK